MSITKLTPDQNFINEVAEFLANKKKLSHTEKLVREKLIKIAGRDEYIDEFSKNKIAKLCRLFQMNGFQRNNSK